MFQKYKFNKRMMYYLGNSQLYFLIVLDRSWSFRLFFYFSWSFMIDIDRSLTVFWSFLIVLDRSWSFLIVCDRSWSFLTEFDQILLFFIFHDRSWSIKRWKELPKNRERPNKNCSCNARDNIRFYDFCNDWIPSAIQICNLRNYIYFVFK